MQRKRKKARQHSPRVPTSMCRKRVYHPKRTSILKHMTALESMRSTCIMLLRRDSHFAQLHAEGTKRLATEQRESNQAPIIRKRKLQEPTEVQMLGPHIVSGFIQKKDVFSIEKFKIRKLYYEKEKNDEKIYEHKQYPITRMEIHGLKDYDVLSC